MPSPVVYRTHHRVRFSDLDPFNHMNTGGYATYFVDHRIEGLAKHLGWDFGADDELPFMLWTRRIEIDFLRPARGGQEITISSFVREFRGCDAYLDCAMSDEEGKVLSRCAMTVTYIDRRTQRPAAWPEDTQALFFEPAAA